MHDLRLHWGNSLKQELIKLRPVGSKLYSDLVSEKVEVDYRSEEIQIAYVLRYFPVYWEPAYRALNIIKEKQSEGINFSKLNFGVFGAGPAPEIIGITYFTEEKYERIQ